MLSRTLPGEVSSRVTRCITILYVYQSITMRYFSQQTYFAFQKKKSLRIRKYKNEFAF